MADPTLGEIMDALADQLRTVLADDMTPAIEGLQVEPRMVYSITPPFIDVGPGDPFQTRIGMGAGNNELNLSIRARVNTPDSEGSQDLLLTMMDSTAASSVELAVASDPTLGGKVGQAVVIECSGYRDFPDPSGGVFLGCLWTVKVIP